MPKMVMLTFFATRSQSKKEHCAAWMAVAMTQPLALLYTSSVMRPGIKDINDMFKNLLMKATNYSMEQQWVGNSTKQALYELFHSIELNPEEQYLSNFSHFMLKFHPSKDNFLSNVLEYQRVKLEYAFHTSVSRFNDDTMFITNAFYGGDNVDLSYGLLNPPVYYFGRPSMLNLGSLGFSINHELGHGIFGTIKKMMHEEDFNTTKFKEKSACLQNQFSNYVLEKIRKKVNGVHTFRENIADLISIELIDKILEELISENSAVLKRGLPALPYSMQQLVFTSMAQFLCHTSDHRYEEEILQIDTHTAPYVRANGMVRNSKTFGNIFNCKPGSNMNPIDKCSFLE